MKKFFAAVFSFLFLLSEVPAQLSPASVTVYKKDTAFSCIAVDTTGNVYAGTNARGMWKFDQKVWKHWSGFGTAFTRSNLRQIATVGKDIWVASSGYVLYLGSGEAGNNNNFWGGMHKLDQGFPLKSTYYRGRAILGQLNTQGPPTRNILGVYIDHTGAPWCAASYHDSITYPAFLNYNARYHFAPGAVGKFNGTNFNFLTGPDLPDPTGILIGIGNNYRDENYSIGKRRTCRSITQVGNEMWVGSDGYEKDAATIITAGILRYGLDGTYIGKYDQNNTPVPFGLTNGDLGPWALYKDVNGRVWATMNGFKGIAVFDNSGWHYIGVPPILASTTLFRSNAITGNANGEVFFGTGSGLLVYKGSGSYTDAASYTVYTTAQGLSSNSILGVAIGKDQSIWAATSAGVNKIARGDLFIYNRKPNLVIFTDQDIFRTPVIHYDSKKTQQAIDKDTLLISADGGRGAIIKWAGSSADKVKFRFAEDPNGSNPDEFGSFSVRHQNTDSVRVLFTHPKFVDEIYTVTNDGGRTVRLQVVDTTVSPANVLINIPVRFVLPPVLMIHGVWSSVGAFQKVQAALLSSYKNYKPYSLLRIWEPTLKHPEPVASQQAYKYVVPNGITQLVENCAINKMAVGKVDILAHSRGGIFSRIYLQERFVNYRNDIHKLITLNTPHSGSQQANLVLDKRLVTMHKKIPYTPLTLTTTIPLGQIAFFLVKDPYDDINGAYELKVNAPAITVDLNGPGNLNRNTTYAHAIVGKWVFGPQNLSNIMAAGLVKGAPTLGLRLPAGLLSNSNTPIDDLFTSIFNGESNDLGVPKSSQEGGLIGANITTFPLINVAHSTRPGIIGLFQTTGVLDIQEVHFKVAELLRAKSTGGSFATDGFHPVDLSTSYTYLMPNPSWLSGTAERVMDAPLTNFNITIDTTLNGKVFAAGDTITVKISKNNTDTVVIAYSGRSVDVYSDVHFGNDTVFKFPVPREAIGTLSIQAYGFNSHQIAYDSAAVTIGTPTGVLLDSIRMMRTDNNDFVTVVQGDSLNFALNGYYSDSIVRDITYQSPLLHTVLGSNISTVLPNRIKGLVVGFDQLIVTYQGKTDTINIEVIPATILPPTLPLPVKFLGITAKYMGDRIMVNWNTAQEINNSRFEVEFSATGNLFTTAGIIAATNNMYGSSYYFNHLSYITGKNYYRIKQVDIDGTVSYSPIVFVTVSSKDQISIYPNPVSGILSINFSNPQNNIKALHVINVAGQVVYRQKVNTGSINVKVAVAHWVPGIYSIGLFSADNKRVYTQEFIKH